MIKVCSSSLRAHMLSGATSFTSMLCFALFPLFFLAVMWSCWSVKSGLLRGGGKKAIDRNCRGKEVPKFCVYGKRGQRKNAIAKNPKLSNRCLRRNDGHVQEAHSGQQAVVGLLCFLLVLCFFYCIYSFILYYFLLLFLLLLVLYLALTCRVFIYLFIYLYF